MELLLSNGRIPGFWEGEGIQVSGCYPYRGKTGTGAMVQDATSMQT